MKRQKYKPYNLDVEYEHRTYKHIGKDYGNSKTADKGLFRNILRCLRRYLNKDEKYYKFCNTYSEWKEYVKEKLFCTYSANGENISKYLNVKKRKVAILSEVSKVALIPIYIAVFSILPDMFPDETWEQYSTYIGISMIIFIIITVVASMGLLNKYNHAENFYQDFIECIENSERQSKC